MRFTLILLAAVCLAQPSKDKSAITGRVINAATGAPLKKASVWLEAFSPTRGVTGAPTVAAPATITDAEGRFTLDGIDPGSYLLLAQRVGYLDQGYGAPAPQLVGPPLDLSAGESMHDLTFKLTPQSLLYGKVVDEDGDPVPSAQVQVLRVSYAGGRRHLVEAGVSASQDDGSFVAGNLTPGRYYLSAGFRKVDESGPPAGRPEREKYVTTYFPSASDAAAATAVEVDPGAEVRGLAIRLRKSRVFHIRGRVVDAESGAPAGRVWLRLAPKGEVAATPAFGVESGADGRFEFGGIVPGSYGIEADNSITLTMLNTDGLAVSSDLPLVGRADVAVTDGDVEDLSLRLGPGFTVAGRVSGVAGGRLALIATDGAHVQPVAAAIKPDGKFELRGLSRGTYAVEIGGLPEGAYVKSVNLAGRSVSDSEIDLTSGASGDLQIEVSPDAGEVAGTVRNAAGDPAPGATVQIWPANGEGARTVKSGPRGEFRFHSLPPAEYRVAAWQDLDDDLAQYAPFRAAFAGDAAKVKVEEKARERIDVKLIGRDAIAAEAAKLK
jgi:protocatechuate 3,4-dioxygenase beta subunit